MGRLLYLSVGMKSCVCSGGLEGGYVGVETSVFKCLILIKTNRCLNYCADAHYVFCFKLITHIEQQSVTHLYAICVC